MALTSFCGLLTLQVGAALLAAVFFTLAGVILAANVFDYHNAIVDGWFPFSLILMIIFVIGLILAGVMMFISSYSESRSMALISVVIIAILFCYWIILCMFSFLSNPDHVDGICIERRCPESFWIANLGYRRQWLDPEDDGYWVEPHYEHTPMLDRNEEWEDVRFHGDFEIEETGLYFDKIGTNILENGKPGYRQERQARKSTSTEEENDTEKNPNYSPEKYQERINTYTGEEEPSRYIFGLPMIGAIILFIINLIFLIFCALVMYSWAQELSWGDYYYEDYPVVVVEDY